MPNKRIKYHQTITPNYHTTQTIIPSHKNHLRVISVKMKNNFKSQVMFALTIMQLSKLFPETITSIRKRSQAFCRKLVKTLKIGDTKYANFHEHYTRFQSRRLGCYYKIWNEDQATRQQVMKDLDECDRLLRQMESYNNYMITCLEERNDKPMPSFYDSDYFYVISDILNKITTIFYSHEDVSRFFENDLRERLNSFFWKLEDAHFDYSRVATCIYMARGKV